MKLCEWLQRARQRLSPRRRVRFAGDNSRYIASARRLCLLIFALGLVAANSAWDQSRYQAAQRLYSYVEKVLTVATAINELELEFELGNNQLTAANIPEIPEGLEVLRPMVGDAAVLRMVKFPGGSSILATTSDPMNSCDPQVYRLDAAPGDSKEQLALWILEAPNSGDDIQARFEDTFVVWFDASCPELRHLIDTFLVVKADESVLGVVLSDDVVRRLGIYWLRSPSDVTSKTSANGDHEAVGHLSDAQDERLSGFDRKQLTTLDLGLLKGRVVSEARTATQTNYAVQDVDNALRAILEGPGADELGMWGLRIPVDALPLFFPLALLSLAFSLLYRLRCIDLSQDILEEPWVVVMPHGTVERVGAAAWSVAPLIAAAGVIWMTLAYHPLDRLELAWRLEISSGSTGESLPFTWWLMKTSLFWSLVVELIAVVFLFQATVWILRIGYWRQEGTPDLRSPRMTAETLRCAQSVVLSREHSIAAITRNLGLPPGTLYRYLYSDGRLKPPGQRLLES